MKPCLVCQSLLRKTECFPTLADGYSEEFIDVSHGRRDYKHCVEMSPQPIGGNRCEGRLFL